MKNQWVKRLSIWLVILLPVLVAVFYVTSATAIYRFFFFPKRIVILTGTEGGLYREIGEELKSAIEEQLGVEVDLPQSRGALDNFEGLQKGKAHFALYQPGTYEALKPGASEDLNQLTTVANLYSQPLHLIVRRGADIHSPRDLEGKRVQLGMKNSGDYAMSRVLLDHVGITEDQLDVRQLSYADVLRGFQTNELDAALITLGVQAPIFMELFKTEKCHLLEIPFSDALLAKNISLTEYTIPAGLYRSNEFIEPASDVDTVAQGAQLLSRRDVPASLVYEVTRIVMGEQFQKQQQLGELYAQGASFAESKPEFSLHTGAVNFYHSEFDVEVFEGWEALYSLAVSILIAAYFLLKSLRNMAARNKEHQLDQYVRRLLKIERSQLDLDQTTGSCDIRALQRLLDEVTQLRQEALQEFTAHELNEDRAVDSFIEMCHALNNKINAKLSRQRLDHAIDRLVEKLDQISSR